MLITFGFASIATGLVLCGFGMTRMGRAIRYVPYPVVGGFLGATGCLILLGSIRVVTGMKLQFATLDRFENMQTLYELAAACAMALVLYLTWHRSRTPFGLPIILIGGTLAAHAAFHLAGISTAEAQALGWTFQPPPHVSLMLPWSAHEIEHYPWYALPEVAGNIIAVIFVTASSTLFNTTGVEVAVQSRSQSRARAEHTGLANMLSGVFGGYTGCISVSRSMLNFSAGGSGRLVRPDLGRDRRLDAAVRAGPARLHAEIRARRAADLSRRRHAAPLDRAIAPAAVARPNICRCSRSSSSSCNGVSSPAS